MHVSDVKVFPRLSARVAWDAVGQQNYYWYDNWYLVNAVRYLFVFVLLLTFRAALLAVYYQVVFLHLICRLDLPVVFVWLRISCLSLPFFVLPSAQSPFGSVGYFGGALWRLGHPRIS